MKRLLLAAFVLALAVPAQASAGRFAIGIEKGADEQAVARHVQAVTGEPVTKIGPFALSVRARHSGELLGVAGASWVERMRPTRRLAFTPNDPLIGRQWYLGRIHAFDAWSQQPALTGVRVAVLDSGIDSGHPDLQNQIVDGRSFVSSSWETDTNGHGTFVAGEIGAALNNGTGIAGVGFPVELLIAKIVRSDGTISPDAEARAIHWAVDNGARVINMSFGGVRDPHDRSLDTYSPLEAAAVQYAVTNGVLVVAAVGNADSAPTEPWNYAGYPAALPHVIGVSSLNRDGTVPELLEPRQPLRGHRRARRVDLLDAAAHADGDVPAQLSPPGLLGLRPDGVPPRRRDVVLGAAGIGRRRRAPCDRPGAAVGSGLEHPHADGRGCGPRHGLRALLHGT